jgi:succinyl-CoA synthetase alpha subunit
MSILVDSQTRVICQGITGSAGRFHTKGCLAYGTKMVGGVTPGKGGESVEGLPVFETVEQAVAHTGADATMIFVPAPFTADAIYEAIDAGIAVIAAITEGVPALDMVGVYEAACRSHVRLIGPNCPGLITPGEAKVGILPGHITKAGHVGIVARSGTLTYEVIYALTNRGMGQSTCVGIGGDPINGTNFIDVLQMFEDDPLTDQVVLIGEIGGSDEERAAEFIAAKMTKPVTAFIAGQTAPPGKRMGHAGAIIEGGTGTAAGKIAALEAVGVRVAKHPEEIPDLCAYASR